MMAALMVCRKVDTTDEMRVALTVFQMVEMTGAMKVAS